MLYFSFVFVNSFVSIDRDAIINSVAEGLSENAARNISLWSFIKLAILGLDLINVNRTTNSRNECTTLPECGRNENLEETHQLGSDAGSSESGCPNNLVSIFLTSCPKLHVNSIFLKRNMS